jgi:hypothetical protein
MSTPDIAGLCERLRRPGLKSAAEAADALERQAAEIERLRGTLGGIKWRDACKDNMEFSAMITCWQMDAIRAALTGEDAAGSPTSQNTEPGLVFSDAGEP